MSTHRSDQPDLPRRASPPQFRPLPLYQLILHADPAQELMFIVFTVMELTHFCRAEATHKMWEAHHWGRSLLLRTYKERAELFVEQFADRGLTVTLEPA